MEQGERELRRAVESDIRGRGDKYWKSRTIGALLRVVKRAAEPLRNRAEQLERAAYAAHRDAVDALKAHGVDVRSLLYRVPGSTEELPPEHPAYEALQLARATKRNWDAIDDAGRGALAQARLVVGVDGVEHRVPLDVATATYPEHNHALRSTTSAIWDAAGLNQRRQARIRTAVRGGTMLAELAQRAGAFQGKAAAPRITLRVEEG